MCVCVYVCVYVRGFCLWVKRALQHQTWRCWVSRPSCRQSISGARQVLRPARTDIRQGNAMGQTRQNVRKGVYTTLLLLDHAFRCFSPILFIFSRELQNKSVCYYRVWVGKSTDAKFWAGKEFRLCGVRLGMEHWHDAKGAFERCMPILKESLRTKHESAPEQRTSWLKRVPHV